MTDEDKKIIREAVELVDHLKEQIPEKTYVITVRNALSLMLAEIIATQTLFYPFAGLEALKELHTYIAYFKQSLDEDIIKNKENETTDIKAN